MMLVGLIEIGLTIAIDKFLILVHGFHKFMIRVTQDGGTKQGTSCTYCSKTCVKPSQKVFHMSLLNSPC